MPELVLSPSLDLTPWSGQSTTTSIYESPMSPTVVKFRGEDMAAPEPLALETAAAASTQDAGKIVAAAAHHRSPMEHAVGLTGLSPAKLKMLQSHFKNSSPKTSKSSPKTRH